MVSIDPSLLPEPDDAVQQMESMGSRLTHFSPFGRDPLESRNDLLQQREDAFKARFPQFDTFFYTVVNGDITIFHEGLLYFIEISKRLETHLIIMSFVYLFIAHQLYIAR